MTFYEKLSSLLKSHNLSLHAFSKETGLSQQTMHSWRYGVYFPRLDTAWIIADYFGITIDELVGRSKHEHTRQPAKQP